MALLHVQEVEPDRDRQLRRRHVAVHEAFQVVVGEQRRVGRHLVAADEERVVRGDERTAVTVAAGVRELDAEEQVRVVAVRGPVGGAAVRDHVGEGVARALVQPDLARVHAAVVGDGARLAPDHLRPAVAEADVAAERELAGPPVGFTVTPLHRVNAPAVPGRARADRQRGEQRREVVGEAEIGAEPGVLRLHLGDRLVLEEPGHEQISEERQDGHNEAQKDRHRRF